MSLSLAALSAERQTTTGRAGCGRCLPPGERQARVQSAAAGGRSTDGATTAVTSGWRRRPGAAARYICRKVTAPAWENASVRLRTT